MFPLCLQASSSEPVGAFLLKRLVTPSLRQRARLKRDGRDRCLGKSGGTPPDAFAYYAPDSCLDAQSCSEKGLDSYLRSRAHCSRKFL
jgi:hypothetical protein